MKTKFSTIVIGAFGLGGFIYLVRLARAETAPKKRYNCVNYQCVEDPNGPYDSLLACQAACTLPVLTFISVSPSSSTINVRGSQLFTATCLDQYENVMSGITISWSLRDSSKASISPTSGVTNASGQTSTILTAGNVATDLIDLILSASSGIKTGSATVKISTVIPILNTISMDPPSKIINEDTQQQITATCLDQFDNQIEQCPILIWESSNTNVATVSSTGLVTAKLVSVTISVNITAKHTRSDGITKFGTSVITVSNIPPVLDTIEIPSPKSVAVGGTTDITAKCKDQGGYTMQCPGTLSWHSTDTLKAKVESTGINTAKITGVAVGTSDITAYYG